MPLVELPASLKLPEAKEQEKVNKIREHTLDKFKDILQHWATEISYDPALLNQSKLTDEVREELRDKFNLQIKVCQLLVGNKPIYFSMVAVHYAENDVAGRVLYCPNGSEQLIKTCSSVTVDITRPPLEFIPDIVILFMQDRAEKIERV